MAIKHSLKKVSKGTIVSILNEYLSKGYDMKFIEKALLKAECPKKILREAKRDVLGKKRPKKLKKAKIKKIKPKKFKAIKPKPAFKPIKAKPKPVKKGLFKQFKPKPRPAPKLPPRVIVPPKKLPSMTGVKVSRRYYPLIVILACIAIILIVLLVMPIGVPDCNSDEACFLPKANACEQVKFKNMIDTTEIGYEVNEDCSVTKTITKLGEREPQEVKDLFLGLSMNCNFQKGAFSRTYITDISGNLETCEGPLATVIAELRR
ncbi:hypothetical protein KY336_04405 [Candidatus Woesearchaeota archaeon]|nr:hypothetical protein [Candidatus Woesearchaeota archaeon]